MVEISKDHAALQDDIAGAHPAPGTGVFWWLGQHTFIVKAGEKVIYIDPFFADWEARQTRRLLTPEEGTQANYVLVTHGHGDHLCPESLVGLVKASPDALFISPKTESHRMVAEGTVPTDRLYPLNAGETFADGSLRITAVKSKHETFDEDPELGFPYLGYVVEVGGVRFYHAGDTIMYDGLIGTLQQWPRFDAMFLPINGRDADRYLNNCIGNFTFQEAVELAGELRPGLAVPSHYDMFIGNQEDPSRFTRFLAAKFPGVPSWVGPAGEKVTFPV